MAYDHGELDLQAAIKVRIGGELVDQHRRPRAAVRNPALGAAVQAGQPGHGQEAARRPDRHLLPRCSVRRRPSSWPTSCASLGYSYATKAGISICIDDMHIPKRKQELLDHAQKDVRRDRGAVHRRSHHRRRALQQGGRHLGAGRRADRRGDDDGDRLRGRSPTTQTGEKRRTPSFNPIYIMADSGARGSAQQIRQLAGMRGLMAKPSGEIIETPITTNFREGLSVLQYFISTHGARKGLADTALKTANSGYLTRRLVDVAQDCVIAEYDCGTIDGIEIAAAGRGRRDHREARRPHPGPRAARGRRSIPYTGEVLVQGNEEITEDKVRIIEDAGIDKVKIRSVLTCETRRGICVLCYGRDLARGHMVNIGEAVGVIAAQSIGEPGTQLTMRTFHIGGVGQVRTEQSQLEARYDGIVKLENVELVKREKHYIVMNRHGEIVIQDDTGRERERYGLHLRRQAVLRRRRQGEAGPAAVRVGSVLACRSSPRSPGIVKFGDVIEGVTMTEQLDEVTGLSRKMHHGVQGRRPAPAHLAQGRPRRHRCSIPNCGQGSPLLPAGGREHRRDRRRPRRGRRHHRQVSRARPPRPRTSPAVCRAWPSCSRPASRRSTRSSPRSTARSASARTPRASARSSSRPTVASPAST